jgi:hypothetical protein
MHSVKSISSNYYILLDIMYIHSAMAAASSQEAIVVSKRYGRGSNRISLVYLAAMLLDLSLPRAKDINFPNFVYLIPPCSPCGQLLTC